MAKTTTCPIPQTYANKGAVIQNSTGNCGVTATTTPSNTVLLYTAAANDANVKSLIVISDDTSAKVLNIYLSPDSGTTFYLLGCVNIPITAGTITGTPPVDILANLPGLPLDAAGKPCLPLLAAERIYIAAQSTVTSGKFLVATALVEEF
jgi:hypothetical protein